MPNSGRTALLPCDKFRHPTLHNPVTRIPAVFVLLFFAMGAYAPFGRRFLAFAIDSIVLGFVMLLAQFTIPYLAPLGVWILYKTVFESSASRATPGKRAMELTVVTASGDTLSFGASILRTFVAWLSVFSCFLIYLVALFTPRKQAIHDLAAGTFVVQGNTSAPLFDAWWEQVKALYAAFSRAFKSPLPSADSEREKLDLLEKLHRLRAEGALTEEEYQNRKRSILG